MLIVQQQWATAFAYYLGFREALERNAEAVRKNKEDNAAFAGRAADRSWQNFRAMAGLRPSRQSPQSSSGLLSRLGCRKSLPCLRPPGFQSNSQARNRDCLQRPSHSPRRSIHRKAKTGRGKRTFVGAHSSRANSRKGHGLEKAGRKSRS